eukprot:NODE_12273_length_1235_cov_4.443141.p2 GENE.NODE_12273_length_1235_cov_4.443141~~NODE_12273_length_1235_cov_4.443141.p2  ORF type:complete len:289 (+),score=89.55 NODE_12273_length_1235_cov_4.443141:39-869(+)
MADAMLAFARGPRQGVEEEDSGRLYAIMKSIDTYASRSGEDLPADDREIERHQSTDQVGVNFFESCAAMLKDGFAHVTKLPGPGVADGGAAGGTTLLQCLAKHAEREQLSEIDAAYCAKCKTHRRQYKKLDLWSVPQTLVVHLNRFGRDAIDGPLEKIEGPVDFPLELDLRDFVRGPELTPAVFDLYAVVNHHGNIGGGHYTAHAYVTPPTDQGLQVGALSDADGEWYLFDDASAVPAAAGDLNKAAAYILFYRRRRENADEVPPQQAPVEAAADA